MARRLPEESRAGKAPEIKWSTLLIETEQWIDGPPEGLTEAVAERIFASRAA